jgi:hypothetical protein
MVQCGIDGRSRRLRVKNPKPQEKHSSGSVVDHNPNRGEYNLIRENTEALEDED